MIAERYLAQLLMGPPARDPVAVAERLLAVQGQDGRGVRLAVRARTQGLTAADFDRALTEERTLLITWCNRGTLHLIRREDYPLLAQLTMPPVVTANARRLEQEGVTPGAAERGVGVIERALAEEGPLTRAQLGERIAAAGVRTEGQALLHLLVLACLRGVAIRGPMIGRQHAYALVHDWLGPQSAPAERDRALAELARRYLRGHAPAEDRDLAKWAGLPLRDARAGLRAIAGKLHERSDGLLELASAPNQPPEAMPPPRLLGAFDPILLGWRARDFVVGRHGPAVMIGGMFVAFALVGGRAAGLWRIERGKVSIEPFHRLAAGDRRALQADGDDVIRYLGLDGLSR
ncbi:MAG: winged helix DNA-binding domain-containing protein [Actinomycetota bacterium]|nr:winged helix DNA-binding domain-containing protein [Actinomycetota bacterium]